MTLWQTHKKSEPALVCPTATATCVYVEADGAPAAVIDGVDIPPEMNAGTADLCPANLYARLDPLRDRDALRAEAGL
jgi:hypothetical protein